MEQIIRKYLDDYKMAWSETTMQSETHRLLKLSPLLETDDPAKVYGEIARSLKPYTIKTVFVRLSSFYQWMIDQGLRTGPNIYKAWMKKHRNLFKHAYDKEELDVSYEEAEARIASITDKAARDAAYYMLRTGMRISELSTVSGNKVIGKGGKARKIYYPAKKVIISSKRIRQALKKKGLKPHQLRKLCATRLVAKGATPADLCHVMGWSSIKTAYVYLQPQQDKRLKEMMA